MAILSLTRKHLHQCFHDVFQSPGKQTLPFDEISKVAQIVKIKIKGK
jgi:hypothetical protein